MTSALLTILWSVPPTDREEAILDRALAPAAGWSTGSTRSPG